MTLSPLETLIKARELISDPERWTQGVYARNRSGHRVIYYESDACRFCSLGAIRRSVSETGGFDLKREMDATSILARAIAGVSPRKQWSSEAVVFEFNDTHTHAEVLAAFDRAIERARADQ